MSDGRGYPALRDSFTVADLLHTICHDVRAALAVTTGSTNELESGEYGALSDSQRELIAMIRRGNQRLGRLANNLMHLGELWEGDVEKRPTSLDAAMLVRASVAELMPRDSSLVLELVGCDEVVNVIADPDRLRQALANVLGVGISVSRRRLVVRLEASASEVTLTVIDDGPDRSRSTKPDARKRISSIELVYAVSNALLELHGGGLHVESPITATGGTRAVARFSR